MKTLGCLPDTFLDNLDESADGCIIIRYCGKRFTVIVKNRKHCSGWRKFIKHDHVISGALGGSRLHGT
ncbi:hypothetical protein LIER_33805 [Lithospermum erythrorhizon]|uniref:TF-B3 domain-containing protein n=1 Tax=Lithospermum erythrorhizon TaxID=34254 RepID=A0AAV3RZ72_LITER